MIIGMDCDDDTVNAGASAGDYAPGSDARVQEEHIPRNLE